MTDMRSLRLRTAVAAAMAVGAMAFVAACGSGDSSSTSTSAESSGGSTGAAQSSEPVTLTWWHNATNDPLKTLWGKVAKDYEAQNKGVTIKVQPIQNEQFPTKIPLALQGDDFPAVYQQWGGGQQATQVQSGKVADITDQVAPWIGDIGGIADGWKTDGKQYGVPYSQHVVGFWYRKDLFEKAGITAPPKTLDELNADVQKLKDAGIAPIAIGAKDRWPAAFWWEYFALRECSTDTMKQALQNVDFSDECFVKAGEDMENFLKTKPFQDNFEGTTAQQGAGSSAGMVANGKAAMELQGTWNPYVMSDLTDDKQLFDKLGWFPFPAIEGGAGDPHAALGGGDGFSCTTKEPDACAAFLHYLVSPAVQKELVSSGATTLPVNPEAASAITEPTVKEIQSYVTETPFMQTYFDVGLPTDIGQAVNDAIADFTVGQGSPEDVVAAVK
jgi:raffinose/stachyose/melibiose transport system substrate-binding protein